MVQLPIINLINRAIENGVVFTNSLNDRAPISWRFRSPIGSMVGGNFTSIVQAAHDAEVQTGSFWKE